MKLRLEKISRQFGKLKVLNELSLTVNDGEILGLIGPNGCGKTTTLLIILGIYRQNSGHIFLGDSCIDDLPIYERCASGILLVPQSLHQFWMAWHPSFCGFIPGTTVFENVRDVVKATRETLRWLKLFSLDSVKELEPSNLSWGQQQKLALIRMCVFKPKVLLLDEAFAATDWETKERLKTYVKKYLKKNQITTVYATSDIVEAKGFCDRIAVINRVTGPPDQVAGT